MTYEERQQAICKECNPDDVGCAYRCRGMTCPRSGQMMDGWELGWQDAIDKACTNLRFFFKAIDEDYDCQKFIDWFKKEMEEQPMDMTLFKCKACKHWCKDDPDVPDDNAYGDCEIWEWGCYGSDPMCEEFSLKNELRMEEQQ